MKKLLEGIFQKQKVPTSQSQSLSTGSPSGASGSFTTPIHGARASVNPPAQYKHGLRSSWDTFFQSPSPAKTSQTLPPQPASASVHVPAKVFNQNLEMLMREIAAEIKDVITKMNEDAAFQNEFAQLCGFINVAADKLLQKGGPSLVLLKEYFDSPAGVSLCEQTAFPSLVLDFVNKVRIYLIKSELWQLEVAISSSTRNPTQISNHSLMSMTAAELERPIRFLMSCVQAIASNFSLMNHFRCELPNVIHLTAEDYPPSARYLQVMASQVLASISDKNFNAGLVWYLKDCKTVGRTVKMMTQYSQAPRATPATAAAASQTLSMTLRSCIGNSQSNVTEPIAAAVSDALGHNRGVESQPNDRQLVVADTVDDVASMPTEVGHPSEHQLVSAYDPAPGFKSLVYILQKTCRFSLVLLGEFQSSGGYGLLSTSIKDASEMDMSTLICVYTLLLPLGTGFSGICGEDENMATVSSCGARNTGAFMSIRDLVLECMRDLKSATGDELKFRLEQLLLQLLTTILQVYTSAYENFVYLEHKTQALAMILSRLPSIAFLDAQVITLRIVEYVCASANANSDLPVEILAVLTSQFIEFSTAEVLDMLEAVDSFPRASSTELKQNVGGNWLAGLVCECILKILKTSRVTAYQDEFHTLGLLERGVYTLFVKVANSISANGGRSPQQKQCLAAFQSRLESWSSVLSLMIKNNEALMVEFRDMQIHHSLYVIADAIMNVAVFGSKKDAKPSVFSVIVVLANLSDPSGQSQVGVVADQKTDRQDRFAVLQSGVESDLAELLRLLQRARTSLQKQRFLMDILTLMLQGRLFWEAWQTCQGHEILLSLLSSFQNLDEDGVQDDEFLQLDGILEMICITLDASCSGNERSVEHFANDIGYSTLASCLVTSGVMETDRWSSVLGRVFELITGLEAPRNKIRNPNAVEMLFCLLPSMAPEHGETYLNRLLSKIVSNDDISFSKKKQVSSLVQAGVLRWIAQPPIIAILGDSTCPAQHVLRSFIAEISREKLCAPHLQDYVRVIAKSMPLLLKSHYNPTNADNDSIGNEGVVEEVGLQLLKMALKGCPVPQVAVGTNVRTRMTSGYVHVVNQSDRTWPPSSGYSLSCWLRFPPIDKKQNKSAPATTHESTTSGTVCVALCEGSLELKLDGDEAESSESYCVLVGAELSLFESAAAAQSSAKPFEILTVTAVAPNGSFDFSIWCHDKRYIAQSRAGGDTDMWVRALQQAESISNKAVRTIKATAENGNTKDIHFVADSETSSAEPIEDAGLEGFVCLLSVHCLEASGCFTRIYFDRTNGCLRIDTGSANAGPHVQPVSKRTSVVYKNVNVDILRSESSVLDDRGESKEKSSQWHHLSVTHRKSALGNSQVTLFIDGTEMATKKLAYPSTSSPGAFQAFLGKDIQVCGTFPALPWQLGPTWFCEDVLPPTAIVCIFLLGPSYRGRFSGYAYRSIGDWPEAIATNYLDRATKRRLEVSQVARRAQLIRLGKAAQRHWYKNIPPGETQPGYTLSDLLTRMDAQNESGVGLRPSNAKKRQLERTSFSSFVNSECRMSLFGLEILDILSGFKLPDRDVYFSINTNFDALGESTMSGGGLPAAQVNFVGTEPSTLLDLAEVLPSLGGVTQFILPLVDNSWRSHELGVTLKLLRRCSRRNPSCLAEFLDVNGYALVASILRNRIHLVDEFVLNAVIRLAVSGTINDGSDKSEQGSAYSSAIPRSYAWPVVVDFAALSEVVLSRHLRQVLQAQYQIKLMMHIQRLLDAENPNAIFNARQLRQANFVPWVLHFIADICNSDNNVPASGDHDCFPTFKDDINNDVFVQVLNLLFMYTHVENHIEDVVAFGDMLLLSLSNQTPFANARSPFRVAILQFLLHQAEDCDGQNISGSPDQGHAWKEVGMKKDKDESDPLALTMVEAILLKHGGTGAKKRNDKAEGGGLGTLSSPTSTTGSSSPASDSSSNSLLGVLFEIICRTDSGKFARLEALLATRLIFTLAQKYPSFARHLFQTPTLLGKLKRVVRNYSSDCNFYTPVLAFVSNIPIRETRYHDPVLAVDDTQQFALPSPSAFTSTTEMEYVDQVWDLLGALLHNNCLAVSEVADKTTVVVLKQLAFQVEMHEAFFTTVCQSSFTILRAVTLCLVHPGDDASSSKTSSEFEGIAGLNSLLLGTPPHSSYGHRASACLELLKIFVMRSLFEREDLAMNLMFLLECIEDEIQKSARHSLSDGQKSWLALVGHVVKHSKALSDNCSFPVLKNLCILSTALARYLVDESKHQEHGQSTATDAHSKDISTIPALKSYSACEDESPTCFGTDVLLFFQSIVRLCAESYIGQVVGVEDQQFFYGCFVYGAQLVLLSELGDLHKCSSPPAHLLECLVNSKHFFIQQTKMSGVIVCGSGHHRHLPTDNVRPTPTSGTGGRALNAHITKMKSLAAVAMHREFGIGAESDRSFLLSLAPELLHWLIDDSEYVRHTSIIIWQFLFQQRMGVVKELLIVEPKGSLLQNMSSNKKEGIDMFHDGFDRLLKISQPRTSPGLSSARISSGELSASHESWLKFQIWLTENYQLLKDLIVTRTEAIMEHMTDVVLSCESVRKVSSSTALNRTSAQADLTLHLNFPRYANYLKLNGSLKSTSVDGLGGDADDLMDVSSCRISMHRAQIKFLNALESSFEGMQDATMRWRDTSMRLQHTRAIWHIGGWNGASSVPSTGGETLASSSRTSSGSQARLTTNEPFYLARSVFQQNWHSYRLDFTEGPQRMRLRMIRGYDTEIESSCRGTTTPKEEVPNPCAPTLQDPLQRKLEFHQCVEAFREFMFKRLQATCAGDSEILKELAQKYNIDRVKQLLRATSRMEDQPDFATILAVKIYSEFLEGDNRALVDISSTVAESIVDAIASARNVMAPTGVTGVTSTLFDVADLEAMQATLGVGGRAVRHKSAETASCVDDSNDDDEEDSNALTSAATSPVLSDSDESASDDEEKSKSTRFGEKTRGVMDSTRVTSAKRSTKVLVALNDADVDSKLNNEPDEKTFDTSSDHAYGAIARFLHREDFPPLRSYNAAHVAGMSKTMGVFLISQNAIYFVGGYGKRFSDADSSTGADMLPTTVSSQSNTSGLPSAMSPTKPVAEKKKTKDLIRETFADIGISFPGPKHADASLYTIVPLSNDTAGEPVFALGSSQSEPPCTSARAQPWSVKYMNVRQFYRVKYQLRPVGIEFFDTLGSTFFVQYESMLEREDVVKVLSQMPLVNSVFWNPLLRSNALSLSVKRIRQNLTKRWLKGGISNFEYLMQLNTLAGRSFNDITQYPVFPWVLADYTSPFLDLEDPASFRDLSKPMGALGKNRAALFRERYAAMNYDALHSSMDTPAFHYGTHYSCSAYVVNFLIRMEPFAQLARELQGGSFDHADRLFRSIPASWHSASTENLQDVRELVPEFFFLPEFLYNANHYDLGTTQGGEVVSHVKLPTWAHGDSREFIRLHRRALESKYVSENLHHWIDLVFGSKQTGTGAFEAQNVFMHFTYEGAVDLDAIEDPVMRSAMLSQIENFGQTPSKLFTAPHPPRKVPSLATVQSPAPSMNSATVQATPPGIGQPSEATSTGSIDGFIKWHTLLAPALISVGNDYVLLKKHSTTNFMDSPVGDVRVVGDKFHCRGVGCTFMPPRYSKYLEWRSNAEGTMKLRVHTSSARHREASKVVGVIDGAHHARITCAAFSADGIVLVTGGQDAVVNVIECSKVHGQRRFKQIAKLVGHEDAVSSVAINRPFNLVASASTDGCVIVWDLRTRTLLRELVGHNGPIIQIGINSMSGNIVACSCSEVRLWSINGDLLAMSTALAVGLSAMTCGLSTNCENWQDGIFAVTGHSNGTITLWGIRFPSEIAAEQQKFDQETVTMNPSYGSASGYSSATLKAAVRIGVARRRGLTAAGSSGREPTVLKAIPTCQFVVKKLLVDHRAAITALTLGADQRQLVSADEDGVCIRWVDDSISAASCLGSANIEPKADSTMVGHLRCAGHARLANRIFALATLLWSLLSTPAVAVSTEEPPTASRKIRHHHCVHEEKSQRFDESVDRDSLTTSQLVLPLESPSQLEVNTFLKAVGVQRHLRSSSSYRSLAASASSASFQPIRIAFDLSKLSSDAGHACSAEGEVVQVDGAAYTCTSGDVLTADKQDFIVTVLLKAIKDYFENTLSVQRVVGNLIVKGIGCSSTDDWACCANAIPPNYKTDGVADADFVLHVTGRPTTGATIAWALPCNIDQFGRPISGQANFGPGLIDPVTVAARTEQIGTALHEMTHALVFSRGRFGDFRQPLNGPKWGYKNVVVQSQGPGGIWVSKIVTPSVARQAKVQFNCFDWVNAGIELENGDSGSADFSSHWEKRILMNEYMTATSSYDPVYSAMTLALFEDSGWYQVSHKNAQILPWGYMEGCGVAQGRCSAWNSRYICNDSSQTGCTADYTSKAYCNVASYTSSIPAGFQYFQDPKYGGRDTYADYCPFYRAYSNGDCRNLGRTPTYVNVDNYMEEVGPNSKCFQSSLSKSGSDVAAVRSACYKVLGCTSTGLRLSIGNNEVMCPMEGGVVRVPGYKGTIVCPVANRLCQMMQDKCSGNGVLTSSGGCECNPGFVGDDCAGIACPVSTINNAECGGVPQGTCDHTTGKCACTSSYTGLTCSELVCPSSSGGKNLSECSSHGSCDRVNGLCNCGDGYSGKACECVPGCTETSCGDNGSCDCLTGACSCAAGYSGVLCSITSDARITELTEQGATVSGTIATKEYKFYRISLNSSTYDITFSVQYANNNGTGVDVDLYGSFLEKYPTSLTARTALMVSDYAIGNRDEINLCGSLGVFPRGLNDTFRFCPRPTSAYVTETPGYFYLSVLGYTGGTYQLSVVTDKCRKITCSNHGACGVNYPGVCTCDRYWSGDDCSVPKCGPDCQDLGTCTTAQSKSGTTLASRNLEDSEPGTDVSPVNYVTTTTGLQTTSECYGNGVCRVTQNAAGRDVPRCVCDDAFTFLNPTPAQALCKELLPSVASVQRYTEPFAFVATKTSQALKISAWALFTIRVKDDWQVLVANLAIQTPETDTMLFVRKEKLPSVVVMSTIQANDSMTTASSTMSSFLQFMDSDGWTSGSATRKVVLTRATSTLSSGLYYIGVFNSAYARASLMYTLTVNATSNCTAARDTDTGYGVCANNGRCNAQSSQICSCPDGFVGKYCDLRAVRAVLSPMSSASATNASATNTSSTTASKPTVGVSYVAYRSQVQQVLPIGEWNYYSFDINDSSVRLAQFRLIIANNSLTGETPVLPLLLVRGPRDEGFPTLFRESQQDFQAIAERSATQSVTVAVDTVCSFATTSKDCYKVAIFNRNYSGEVLRYHLEVSLFESRTAVFPSASCGYNSNQANCHDNGKCLMISDSTNTTTNGQTVPTCQCNTGWTGLRCNSPKAFDMPQLWSAISNISLLCPTCNATFSLGRGEVKMFRVPSSLRPTSGLLLRVVPTTKVNTSAVTGTLPNVYVSETLPRSLYDFTHISNGSDSTANGRAVRLTNESLTGLFWVVVFTDYPASDASDLSSASSRSRRQRRLGVEAIEAETIGASFQLQAEVFALGDDTDDTLLTNKSFGRAVVDWLFTSRMGVAVFALSVVFLVLVVCFCLWRLCHAPENQDKATTRFFGVAGNSQPQYPTGGVSLGRVGAAAHVTDVERGTPRSPSRV